MFIFRSDYLFNHFGMEGIKYQFHFDTEGDNIRHGNKKTRFVHLANSAFPHGVADVFWRA